MYPGLGLRVRSVWAKLHPINRWQLASQWIHTLDEFAEVLYSTTQVPTSFVYIRGAPGNCARWNERAFGGKYWDI